MIHHARGAQGLELIDADHDSEREDRLFTLSNVHGYSNATMVLQHQRITLALTDAILAVFERFEQKVNINNFSDVPNITIVNTGLWSINNGKNVIDHKFIHDRGDRVHTSSQGRIKLIWKTTTSTRIGYQYHIEDEQRVQQELAVFGKHSINSSWGYLDAFEASRSFENNGLDLDWDDVHFLPIGYEILNDILLNQMCGVFPA